MSESEHIYRDNMDFDLGTPDDSGGNFFNTEQFYDQLNKLWNKPEYLIVNTESDTVSAVGNIWYWFRTWDWFDGPVDTCSCEVD